MHMTPYEIISAALALVAVVLIPLLALVIRVVVKMTRTDDKLTAIADSVTRLVKDKDAVHAEIITQMREDRKATDERLRWLERNVWRKQARGLAP